MKWRFIGTMLLLLSIVLASLHIEFPIVNRSNVALEEHGVPVVFMYPAGEFVPFFVQMNTTLIPSNKTYYDVNALVTATVWNSSLQNYTRIDFWVINNTGRNLLYEYLENNTYEFNIEHLGALPSVKAYAKGLDMDVKLLQFEGLDYDGEYWVALINPYASVVANVSVVIEETWKETWRLIEPNIVSVSVTLVIAVVGLYMTVKNPRWLSKKARRTRTRL